MDPFFKTKKYFNFYPANWPSLRAHRPGQGPWIYQGPGLARPGPLETLRQDTQSSTLAVIQTKILAFFFHLFLHPHPTLFSFLLFFNIFFLSFHLFSFLSLSHFPSHDHPLLALFSFSPIFFLSLHFSLPHSLSFALLSSISLSHISTVIFTPTVHLTTGMSHHLHHHSPPPTTSSASTTETFISMAATSILALGFFKRMR